MVSRKNKIIKTWKTYIEAQEAQTKQFSEPFEIKMLDTDSSDFGKFEIRRFDPLHSIYSKLESAFPGIQKENVFLDQGYFLHDAVAPVRNTKKLQEFTEANYFEFSPNPCFSGEVALQESPFEWIHQIIGQYPNKDGGILATWNEIDAIDQQLIIKKNFKRDKLIGAVFRATPSADYISTQYIKLCDFLRDRIGSEFITLDKDRSIISCKNIFLKKPLLDHLNKRFVSFKSYHKIIFEIEEEPLNEFLESTLKRHIYIYNNSKSASKINFGLILPKLEDNKFIIDNIEDLSFSALQFKIFRFQRLFERYFEKEQIKITHYQELELSSWVNQKIFYDELKKKTSDHQFNLGTEKNTIAFDFQTKEDLQEGVDKLMDINIADIDYHFDNHKFKVTMQYESALVDLQQELATIPSVSSEISPNQSKLTFYCSFPNQDLQHILKSRVFDILQRAVPEKASFHFHELTNGYLKYHLSFKESEYLKNLQKKLDYLNGEVVTIATSHKNEPIGTITKATVAKDSSSYLEVRLENSSEFTYPLNDWITVMCELRGEQDKIKRLADTVETIFSDGKPKIPNPKLTSILVDSSEASTFDGEILRSQSYLETEKEVTLNLLSNKFNEKQLQAVCKSLLTDDFFMIQGPPGTGKSTAISELIWQHLRKSREKNQDQIRVLVTSETNLAVDNALEKLRSVNHMLIKPIRFGSEDKLDKEGKQFSLEHLTKWANDDLFLEENDEAQENILDRWIRQVKSRSIEADSPGNQQILKKWREILSQKEKLIRSIFYKSYVTNANVIGATCSSIGKTNSIGRFTSFFHNYCKVAYPSEYKKFRDSPDRKTATALKSKEIIFDLVVQDEASKASPPELALPCLYGKKAIIIGDHRQLPPMVDTYEFLESLKDLRRKSKVPEDKKGISSLISYISSNRDLFAKSHFENLFFGLSENLRTSFDTQYRMHPSINETVKQFYAEDEGLKCGISEEEANSPNLSNPMSRYHGVIETPNTHVMWIDTKTPEIKKGTSRFNPGEVRIIDRLLSKIYDYPGYHDFINFWPEDALDEKQIGIITFYGAQTGELSKLRSKYPDMPLRISPVDRFQGMERNIIIVSLVRSNCIANFPNQPPNHEDFGDLGYDEQTSLGFAEFPNRLNVALSRAKRLLVIVGNSDHFRSNPQYDRVYKTIENSLYGKITHANEVS